VRIEAVGEKGDGIAKKKGFVLFVPNTKEGDEVKVKVTKVLQKVGFAEVVGQATPGSAAQEEKPRERQKPKEEDELIPAGEDSESFGEEEELPSEEDSEKASDEDSEENLDEPPQPD
jgi:predicted RNA-binding protein with TRAM domain